jgi:endonuclease III related protein
MREGPVRAVTADPKAKAPPSLQLPSRRMRRLFEALYGAYGSQRWWPGETPFEVMVGAVLTQNTAWVNVERAIENLKACGRLDPQAITATEHRELADLLRPSGYFNIKARRLRSYCQWYLEQGGFTALAARPTPVLRRDLLAVHGIGPETADDILLYAFERPVFVVDAYTRRLLGRLGLIEGGEHYEVLRLAVESCFGPRVSVFNELHALVVRHAKDVCRPRPDCAACCLAAVCPRRGS